MGCSELGGLDRAGEDGNQLVGFADERLGVDPEQLGLLSEPEPVESLAQFLGGDSNFVNEVSAAFGSPRLFVVGAAAGDSSNELVSDVPARVITR